jgi:uncharacterized protein (TIRG00374 family)
MMRGAISSGRAVAAYAAAGVLLWLFLRGTETHVMVDAVRSAAWRLLALAVVLRLASLIVSSLRWQVLLLPLQAVPFEDVASTMMMGMAVAAVAPMQAAEVVRPYLLARRRGIDFSATLATIIVEWVLDTLGTLVFFVPAVVVAMTAGAAAGQDTLIIATVTVVLVIGLLAALPGWVTRLAAWSAAAATSTAGWRARLATQSQYFCNGLGIVHRRPQLIKATAYTAVIAVLTAVSAWMTLVAFGLPMPLSAGFLLLGLVMVGGLLPTPGAVGSFHAICQLGLVTFFHVDRTQTVLPVIALHAVLYLPGAVVGALCFIPGAAASRARAY